MSSGEQRAVLRLTQRAARDGAKLTEVSFSGAGGAASSDPPSRAPLPPEMLEDSGATDLASVVPVVFGEDSSFCSEA